MALTQAQQTWLAAAIPAAQQTQTSHGVPASVTLAQAILESGWGVHHIGTANNYFGIKASGGTGTAVTYGAIATGYVTVPTREVLNGQSVTVQANFRSYPDMTASFQDHAAFLRANSRYAAAFSATDGIAFARAVAAAGYATDPTYADTLASIITSQQLAQYDTPVDAGTTDTDTSDADTSDADTDASDSETSDTGSTEATDPTDTTDTPTDSTTDETDTTEPADTTDTTDDTDTTDTADSTDSTDSTEVSDQDAQQLQPVS